MARPSLLYCSRGLRYDAIDVDRSRAARSIFSSFFFSFLNGTVRYRSLFKVLFRPRLGIIAGDLFALRNTVGAAPSNLFLSSVVRHKSIKNIIVLERALVLAKG